MRASSSLALEPLLEPSNRRLFPISYYPILIDPTTPPYRAADRKTFELHVARILAASCLIVGMIWDA